MHGQHAIKEQTTNTMTKTKLKPLTAAQRVEVLKDAISQIKKGYLTPEHDSYVGNYFLGAVQEKRDAAITLLGNKGKELELKDFLPEILKIEGCSVCAKGAIVISAISKFNNCTLTAGVELDNDATRRARILFGTQNADTMEVYFEGWTGKKKQNSWLVTAWKELYPEPHEILIKIFKNAIENKGIFCPEQNKKAMAIITALKKKHNNVVPGSY
jgi:hypothetical protein